MPPLVLLRFCFLWAAAVSRWRVWENAGSTAADVRPLPGNLQDPLINESPHLFVKVSNMVLWFVSAEAVTAMRAEEDAPLNTSERILLLLCWCFQDHEKSPLFHWRTSVSLHERHLDQLCSSPKETDFSFVLPTSIHFILMFWYFVVFLWTCCVSLWKYHLWWYFRGRDSKIPRWRQWVVAGPQNKSSATKNREGMRRKG